MGKIITLETVQDYNTLLGYETYHPLVGVIDFLKLESLKYGRKNFGFYAVFLKDLECGDLSYGRSKYDYEKGSLVFVAPGQIAGKETEETILNPRGWALVFHPDFLKGTALGKKIKEYHFFSYEVNEALHMSLRERDIVINCLQEIQTELEQSLDRHSKSIITANIEVLLNYCVRFYDRQFLTREVLNKDILVQFEKLLEDFFDSETPRRIGLPTVKYCASELCLSPNYFGDLIKRETGKSAQQYIQLKIIERIKGHLNQNDKSISEIAYYLGFKYPHHMSRLFKGIIGYTPQQYRSGTF